MKARAIQPYIKQDLSSKMVFLSGPRQSGKTTLAELLLQEAHGSVWQDHYLNWDDDEQRSRILEREFPPTGGLLVFDELHKYTRWRGFLKGLYDTRKRQLNILVTGSGRLDQYRRGGDSLQGRYHHLRLYPFSMREAGCNLEDLSRFGPFPEPLFSGTERLARRWSREHRTRIIRDELVSLEQVLDLGGIELLTQRLPDLVGAPLSINSLREDLQVAHLSVTRWLEMLERLFFIFRIYPFGAPRIKAVKKESKHYHFDWTTIADEGAKFENIVAFHLLKHCHFIEDVEGFDCELRFFRDIEGREVDFVVLQQKRPTLLVECKLSEKHVSPHLRYLKRKFKEVEAVQVIGREGVDMRDAEGVRVCSAAKFLLELVI